MAFPTIDTYVFEARSGEIHTSLIVPEYASEKLAVVLPGAGYSCKQPLLYYAIQILLQRQFKVLRIEKVYGEDPRWAALKTMEEALKVVEDDAIALFDAIERKFSSGIHTVVGRSLGTYAMACALEKQALSPRQLVWQTPSLNGKWEIINKCGIRGLAIIGTADERYQTAKAHLPKTSIVIENADHAMEISDDPIRSIEILGQVSKATSDWLDGGAYLEQTSGHDIDRSQLARNLALTPEQRLIEHQSALDLVFDLEKAGRALHEKSQ